MSGAKMVERNNFFAKPSFRAYSWGYPRVIISLSHKKFFGVRLVQLASYSALL
jgi:hypothetical protein